MTDARSGTTGLSGPAPVLAGLAIMTSMALAACAGDAPMEAEPATPVPIMLMEAPSDPEAIRPFTIDVPEEVLVDLQNRLARARLPDQIPGAGWDYGTDRAYLEELFAYWQDGFDWRAQEQVLNRFDHFKTVIDGVDVHFIHQRSPNEDATPLLLTHGWPGSFTEFTRSLVRSPTRRPTVATRATPFTWWCRRYRIRVLGQTDRAGLQPGTNGRYPGGVDGAARV